MDYIQENFGLVHVEVIDEPHRMNFGVDLKVLQAARQKLKPLKVSMTVGWWVYWGPPDHLPDFGELDRAKGIDSYGPYGTRAAAEKIRKTKERSNKKKIKERGKLAEGMVWRLLNVMEGANETFIVRGAW